MTSSRLEVSGVDPLEKDISERWPEYCAYMQHTNAFVPGLPRHLEGTAHPSEIRT
ncbi:MAG: hypothetical protein MUF66_04165 [Gammaproteobacteria bacterium]|jgi:steroid 5-alpha reductase family enzyme|nr:hypothetical protein [Gammaproteobacteria bacterium]